MTIVLLKQATWVPETMVSLFWWKNLKSYYSNDTHQMHLSADICNVKPKRQLFHRVPV